MLSTCCLRGHPGRVFITFHNKSQHNRKTGANFTVTRKLRPSETQSRIGHGKEALSHSLFALLDCDLIWPIPRNVCKRMHFQSETSHPCVYTPLRTLIKNNMFNTLSGFIKKNTKTIPKGDIGVTLSSRAGFDTASEPRDLLRTYLCSGFRV